MKTNIHPISGAGTTADTSLSFSGGVLTVIPEPSTTGVMAMIALGVGLTRRRRG